MGCYTGRADARRKGIRVGRGPPARLAGGETNAPAPTSVRTLTGRSVRARRRSRGAPRAFARRHLCRVAGAEEAATSKTSLRTAIQYALLQDGTRVLYNARCAPVMAAGRKEGEGKIISV